MTKVYSNKEKKSVTNMRARDLDAADLDKFTGVGSNCSMTKKEINYEQLWSEIQLHESSTN